MRLTSLGNVAICESLGVDSHVHTYDQLDPLPADTPCVHEWGLAEFNQRLENAWHGFCERAVQGPLQWLQVQRHQGLATVQEAHVLVLGQRGDLGLGHKLSLSMAPAR